MSDRAKIAAVVLGLAVLAVIIVAVRRRKRSRMAQPAADFPEEK
jgi:cbb3-type cytochrome oxidase subunit 3